MSALLRCVGMVEDMRCEKACDNVGGERCSALSAQGSEQKGALERGATGPCPPWGGAALAGGSKRKVQRHAQGEEFARRLLAGRETNGSSNWVVSRTEGMHLPLTKVVPKHVARKICLQIFNFEIFN